MNNSCYSVLMSVYEKESPLFLKESIESILNQTVKTNDFVIVCDGPLTKELDSVLNEYSKNNEVINIIRLPENLGLGNALKSGITHCKNEIILRQDSDDISVPQRASMQLQLISDTNSDIVSGTITEFIGSTDNVTGLRKLPLTQEEIYKFSKKRNPFNHPAVAFRKQAVLDAGNYSEKYHFFEDYYLWMRMLDNKVNCANLEASIVFMRVDDNTYLRRGGRKYASDMLSFHNWLRKTKKTSLVDFLTGSVPHAVVCVLPSGLRKIVYKKLH